MPNQKFSLVQAIDAIVNNRSLDEASQKVHEAGLAEIRKNNMAPKGQFAIPVQGWGNTEETRGAILAGTTGQGEEVIQEEKLNLVLPLRERLVLAQAGATILTGCVGDISIPYYSGSTASWKSEAATADRGEGQFSEKFLRPKRMSSVIHVSKQFLRQTGPDVENALRKDLLDAIAVTLEKTILGDGAGNTFTPAGLFAGVTPETSPFTFSDSIMYEAELEHNNVYGDLKYIVSPSAKAIMRSTPMSANGVDCCGRFVMESNEVNGLPVYSTGAVVDKGILLGDIKEIWIAQYGAVELTYDPYVLADQDIVRLIVTSYWDCVVRRDDAIVKKILA